MKTNRLFAFLLLSFFITGLSAQNPTEYSIEFDGTTKDFGEVEYAKPAEHVFVFKNVTDAPVKLSLVKASCGCTTPSWTKDEVKPGGEGQIKVKYDTKRVGPFNKSIRVMYEGMAENAQPIMLYIKGKVLPNETDGAPADKGTGFQTAQGVNTVTPTAATKYTVARGAISFERLVENVGGLSSQETKSAKYKFINTSDKIIHILDKFDAPDGVTITPAKKELKPNEESFITVTVSGEAFKKRNVPAGYFNERIAIFTDEPANGRKEMTVAGNFSVVFTDEEKAMSPRITFAETDINGGKIIEGEKFEYDFTFTNEGKSDLIIYDAKASCGCTASKPDKEVIKPGETGSIHVTFNSERRMGKQSKSITVRSNDVEHPTTVLKFTVEVVKDPFHAGGMMGGSN